VLGVNNTASSGLAVAIGGSTNTASGANAVVLGGYNCTASGYNSVIIGGNNQTAPGADSIHINKGLSNVTGGTGPNGFLTLPFGFTFLIFNATNGEIKKWDGVS